MARRFIPSLFLMCASTAAVVALTGCGALIPSQGPALAGNTGAFTMGGKAFGGVQPISNATISLYSAGNTGYGTGATLRATTSTGNDGSFSFSKLGTNSDTINSSTSTWACPTTGDPLIYLVATGGNPTGNGQSTPNNTGIGLMVPLGVCSSISAATHVVMNEATTVASVAALQQFFNPATRSIGSSSSAMSMQALLDAAATVTNMVDISQGIARPTTLSNSGGYNVSAVTITVTPETAKIYTMANILAACVNSTSSSSTACSTLFASAVPQNPAYTSQPSVTFNTATDTLMAVYYMLTNPTSGAAAANDATNLNALMALQVPTSPFQPALTSTPTDWTIGIRYDAGNVANCGSQKFLSYVYHVAVDASGNVWGVSNTAGGGIFQLSPTGTPLTCALNGASTAGFTTATIDPAGNIWVGNGLTAGDTNLYEWIPGTNTASVWPTIASTAATADRVIMNVVSDATNNIMFGYNGNLVQIDAATALAGNPSSSTIYGTKISTGVKSQPYFIAVDAASRIYNSYQGTTTAGSETLVQVYPDTGSGNLNGYSTNSFTDSGTNFVNYAGIAIGKNEKVWVLNGATTKYPDVQNALASFTPNLTGGGGTVNPVLAPFLGGINNGRDIAVDGAGNVFGLSASPTAGNYASGATGYVCGTNTTSNLTNVDSCWTFSEIADDGTPISATGTGSDLASINGGFQKYSSILPFYGRSIAVTPSGNVWIGSNSSGGRGITEIVGQGVPVVTPFSQSLHLGASIMKP